MFAFLNLLVYFSSALFRIPSKVSSFRDCFNNDIFFNRREILPRVVFFRRKRKKRKKGKKGGKRAFKMLGKYATYTCTVHSTRCRYRVVKGEKAKNLLSHRQRYHSTIHDFLTSISALCPPLLRRAIFLHQRFLRILTNITPGMRLKTRAL